MKVQRTSKVLRLICKVLLVLFICVIPILTGTIVAGWGTLYLHHGSIKLASLALSSRLVFAVIVALEMAVKFKGIYHLYRLFGNYATGNIFTTESAGQIRQLGVTVLLLVGVNILFEVAAVAFALYPRNHMIGFSLNSLVTGFVIIVISWFMQMGAEMREESELTI
ncbi:MAG: DUF2975 domain-containing protein [Verrucomicrobiia bacterium]|jgi:hypothetical protein